MAQKIIGNTWDRESRNNLNDNFTELYRKYLDFVGEVSEDIREDILQNSYIDFIDPVDSANDLPSGAKEGDTSFIIGDGSWYRWNGEEWRKVAKTDPNEYSVLESMVDDLSKEFDKYRKDLGDEFDNFKDDVRLDFDDLKKDSEEYIEELNDEVEEKVSYKGAMLSLTSNQTIKHDKWTMVEWGKADYNYSGFWSSGNKSRIIIPKGVKKVRISFNGLWESNNNGNRRIRLMKNGGYVKGGFYTGFMPTGTAPVSGTSGVMEVSEGDYFECQIVQTSGEDIDFREDPYTYATIEVLEYSKK